MIRRLTTWYMPARAEAMTMIRAILFDLDGTLLDTAPDLASALNRVRAKYGLSALPYASIRPLVSQGSVALTRLGFDLHDTDQDFERRRSELLDEYRARIAELTCLVPHLSVAISALVKRGFAWGIVTNKPGWLTTPLLAAMALEHPPDCVVSGDTLVARKPDPAPLHHAARQLGCLSRECVYVGDAASDVEAGRRAGMTTVAAGYGYLDSAAEPQRWGADVYVDTSAALAEWLAELPAAAVANG